MSRSVTLRTGSAMDSLWDVPRSRRTWAKFELQALQVGPEGSEVEPRSFAFATSSSPASLLLCAHPPCIFIPHGWRLCREGGIDLIMHILAYGNQKYILSAFFQNKN